MNALARIALALFALCYFQGAKAQEVSSGYGLICNTADEIRNFVSNFNGSNADTLQKVNVADNVCGILAVAYVRGEEVGPIQTKNGPAVIVKIAVVAINVGQGWMKAPPFVQYTLFFVKGRDA